MRLLVTADLHYDHPGSRASAQELIDRMNMVGGDAVLLVGDTATADSEAMEECLHRFRFSGPKLYVAGNHELWTHGPDSHAIYAETLPKRVHDAGWTWLEDEPYVIDDEVAIVGSIGWYDYSFAAEWLGIPRRFYEHKLSPAAAERLREFSHLLEQDGDIPPPAREIAARWNDGKFVKLGRSDEQFLAERMAELQSQLESLGTMRQILVAVHHLPFAELLPPPHHHQRDFARAFLGSGAMGRMVAGFPNVNRVICGHSHFAAEARLGAIHATNVGSGYRHKTFLTVDL